MEGFHAKSLITQAWVNRHQVAWCQASTIHVCNHKANIKLALRLWCDTGYKPIGICPVWNTGHNQSDEVWWSEIWTQGGMATHESDKIGTHLYSEDFVQEYTFTGIVLYNTWICIEFI